MTEKQIERVKKKIEKYKKALADDKKFWRGYHHDGRGIRYLIPAQFIKIEDYKGGLRYLNWFNKYFPRDSAYGAFLFECSLILYKCGKLKDAEKKAELAFFSNIYLFDKFFGKELIQISQNEQSDWDIKTLEKFPYRSGDSGLIDFAQWMEGILSGKEFLDKVKVVNDIEQLLENEDVGKRRSMLVNKLYKLKYGE